MATVTLFWPPLGMPYSKTVTPHTLLVVPKGVTVGEEVCISVYLGFGWESDYNDYGVSMSPDDGKNHKTRGQLLSAQFSEEWMTSWRILWMDT